MAKTELIRAVKGMNDILPGESERWQVLEAAFVRSAKLFGYREVRTPLVEPTGLFVRSIGEGTDVVGKEMYTFDHHEVSLTLRPEGTASTARAYLEHHVREREPVSRWYYLGPMFRAEQPQRGRYRQFHQAGCEVFGDPGPACDAELIGMLHTLFRSLGIDGLEVAVSSLGGPDARTKHRDALSAYLGPHAGELSAISQQRLVTNPLRILDSKDERDRAILAGAPTVLDFLSDDDRAHFDELRAGLDATGTPYVIDAALVRGLDYYSRTVFEIRSTAGALGAQNTIAGGGRYDDMLEGLGGPSTPAIGFAMGLERLLLAMTAEVPATVGTCLVATMGARANGLALAFANDVRAHGVPCEVDARPASLKAKLRRANTLGARVCVLVGDTEVERGVVQVKDLEAHTQHEMVSGDAVRIVADKLLGSAGVVP